MKPTTETFSVAFPKLSDPNYTVTYYVETWKKIGKHRNFKIYIRNTDLYSLQDSPEKNKKTCWDYSPSWIHDAETENFSIFLSLPFMKKDVQVSTWAETDLPDDNFVPTPKPVWINGVWQGEEWSNSIWKNGTFEGNFWCGGIWENGFFGFKEPGSKNNKKNTSAFWTGGIWINGTWGHRAEYGFTIDKISDDTNVWVKGKDLKTGKQILAWKKGKQILHP